MMDFSKFMNFIFSFFCVIFIAFMLNIVYDIKYNLYYCMSLCILLFIYFYKYNKISFFLLIQFIISFIWCSLSLFYIESDNYISEQDIIGNNIGSLFRYIFYYSIFIIPSYLIIDFHTNRKLISKSFNHTTIKLYNFYYIHKFTKLFFIIIISLCLFIGVKYGFPLLSGIARFEFHKQIGIFDKVIFLIPILAFFIGISNSCIYSNKNFLYLAILIFFLILFSDKFSSIYGIIIYYSIGYMVTKNISNNTNKIGFSNRILYFYLPIIFLALVGIVIIGYIILHNANENDIQARIISRALGLQAHVWYGIDSRLYTGSITSDINIFFLQSNEPAQPAGLAYLMYQVSDYNFVRAFRDAGIRFTNGYPAIVLISFGFLYSIVILLLLGIILGYFQYYLFLKIYFMQPLRLLIMLIFYNNILINILVMGEIFYIYKPLAIICFSLILLDSFIFKHRDFRYSKF